MERELGRLRWILLGVVILLVAAAGWMFSTVPCEIINGVGYCSFHERAEELHEAWKGLSRAW